MQQGREIEAARLPVVDRLARIEPVDAADHFVDGAKAELRHDLPQVFREEIEEVHHVLGFAGEFGPQPRVLGGDAYRARIEMAHAHHDAPGGDERCAGDAEFFGAQQRRDGDVAPRF